MDTILLVAAIILLLLYNVYISIACNLLCMATNNTACAATNQHNTNPTCYSLLFLSLLHCACASVVSGMLCSTLAGSVDTRATCTCVCCGSALCVACLIFGSDIKIKDHRTAHVNHINFNFANIHC